MSKARPQGEAADVIGRLLVRVYEIHARVLAKGGGGIEGIRDAAMLHAAVSRPFVTFEGAELYPSDLDKAAALFHSLVKSHPFLDGTKRTAFAAALYLLHERGYSPRQPLPKDDVVRFCVELAEENRLLVAGEEIEPKTIEQIAAWLDGLVTRPL